MAARLAYWLEVLVRRVLANAPFQPLASTLRDTNGNNNVPALFKSCCPPRSKDNLPTDGSSKGWVREEVRHPVRHMRVGAQDPNHAAEPAIAQPTAT